MRFNKVKQVRGELWLRVKGLCSLWGYRGETPKNSSPKLSNR